MSRSNSNRGNSSSNKKSHTASNFHNSHSNYYQDYNHHQPTANRTHHHTSTYNSNSSPNSHSIQYLLSHHQFRLLATNSAHNSVYNNNSDSHYVVNPDLLLDWSLIEEVIYPTTELELNCPICLCTPVIPKISRCGHLYCYQCILHYLDLNNRSSSRCPLCKLDRQITNPHSTIKGFNKLT